MLSDRAFDGIVFTDVAGPIWSRAIGAYRFANALRAQGLSIKVVDCLSDFSAAELDQLLSICISPSTLFVGLSSTFMHDSHLHGGELFTGRSGNPLAVRQLIRILREKYPWVKIVLGGARVDAYLNMDIDIFVTGYVENAVAELILALRSNSIAKRVIVRGANKEFDFNHLVTTYQQDDHIFPLESLMLETSRGCRFKCKFCNFPLIGRKPNTYFKTANSLREEMLQNYERHGVKTYFLSDDTFNESQEKLEYFLNIFQSLPFRPEFFAFLRLDLLLSNEASIDLLPEMGLRGTCFGIESLYDPAARAIGKGMGKTRTLEGLHHLRRRWGDSVMVTTSYILGLPQETEESARIWMEELLSPDFPSDYIALFPLMITLPGESPFRSDIAQQPDAFGYNVAKGIFGPSWESSAFTKGRCEQIVIEFYQKMASKRGNFVYGPQYPFLRGYGLTHEEVLHFARTGDEVIARRIRQQVSSRVSDYKRLQLRPGRDAEARPYI